MSPASVTVRSVRPIFAHDPVRGGHRCGRGLSGVGIEDCTVDHTAGKVQLREEPHHRGFSPRLGRDLCGVS
ncbi:MAG: hypothetical protein ACRDRT_14220, partial [Pseudonocardiaceae bacterium]